MSALLIDTHIWAWTLHESERLTPAARAAIAASPATYVSPISIFEIGQKVRIGRWPEMDRFADDLASLVGSQGGRAAPLTPEICHRAARLDWDHRDPFDRIIAATALVMSLPLVTRDAAFAGLPGLRLIW